ncbi:hypothetical protein SISSUDRAFT_1048385, partial [Sistotremastrum suecicum HHB10207 ss-3]
MEALALAIAREKNCRPRKKLAGVLWSSIIGSIILDCSVTVGGTLEPIDWHNESFRSK